MPTTARPERSGGSITSHAGRRGHHRVDCDFETAFTISNTGQSGVARCVNIGLGGLRVDFPIEIMIPSELQLSISFPSGESLQATTRVVWTVTDRIDGPFPTGLQFGDLPDAQRRRLYDIVDALSNR